MRHLILMFLLMACKTPQSQLSSGEPDAMGYINYRSAYDRSDWTSRDPQFLEWMDQSLGAERWEAITDVVYPMGSQVPRINACRAKFHIKIPQHENVVIEWDLDTQGAPRLSRMMAIILQQQLLTSRSPFARSGHSASVNHAKDAFVWLEIIDFMHSIQGPSENLTRVNIDETKICQVPVRDGDVVLKKTNDSLMMTHLFVYHDSQARHANKPVGVRVGKLAAASLSKLDIITKRCGLDECLLEKTDVVCEPSTITPLKLSSLQNFQPISSECL